MALELSDRDHEAAGRRLTALLRDYERSLPQRPIVPALDHDLLERLLAEPFADQGVGVEKVFDLIRDQVVPSSTAVAHPRFLAYVLGPPNGIAPYADAVAAMLNQNCNVWQLSPAASVIERAVVRWLGGQFGYGDDAGGLMTDGGSAATLIALSAAINHASPQFRTTGLQAGAAPLVVYTSEQAHRCVQKNAAILGLGVDNVRTVPVDEHYRMRPSALQEAVQRDRAAGLRPFCVVATAGTVNTGAIDPIEEIADLCQAEGLWLHVDGAYGALFVLSDAKRAALRACGRADSIALDPHKLLFAPLEAGCLVVRDPEKLRRAFGFTSSYLTVADDPLMVDFMDYGPQLSRGFKAFKVWCALKTFGVGAFRETTDRMLALAGYLSARIEATEGLQLMAPVELTAVCFTVDGFSDSDYTRLLKDLASDGTALLGPVVLDGRAGVRVCIANYRTTSSDIDLLIDRLSQGPVQGVGGRRAETYSKQEQPS